MPFKMIVALDRNGGIGKDNKIPWQLPSDLKHFAKMTKGTGNNAIVMGRNTYNSIGRVLPRRSNIVLTRDTNFDIPDIFSVSTFDNLLNHLGSTDFDDIWIIGGATLYRQFLEIPGLISQLYVTEIDEDFQCDTFFLRGYEKLFRECEVISRENNVCYKKYFSPRTVQNAT